MSRALRVAVAPDGADGYNLALDLTIPYGTWGRGWWLANRAAIREVAPIFLAARLILAVVTLLAAALLPEQRGQFVGNFHASNVQLFDSWARWDSAYFLDVAKHGYTWRPYLGVFFPLYPLLMRLVAPFVGYDWVVSGIVVSSIATFIALIYLHKLVALELGEAAAGRAVFYLLVYPTALFLFAVYSESLFLALTVATFYYLRQRRWGPAAVAAFLAGLTRVNAIVLCLPLAFEAWGYLRSSGSWRHLAGDSWRRLVPSLLALAAAPAAILGFAGYIALLTGDPLDYVHIQGRWPFNRHPSLPWDTLLVAVGNVLRDLQAPAAFERTINTQDLVATIFILGVCVVAWRALPRSYAIYMSAVTLFLLTSTLPGWALQSMPRYTLTIFPLFLLLARLGSSRFWNGAIIVLGAPLLGMYTAFFAQWYWVF